MCSIESLLIPFHKSRYSPLSFTKDTETVKSIQGFGSAHFRGRLKVPKEGHGTEILSTVTQIIHNWLMSDLQSSNTTHDLPTTEVDTDVVKDLSIGILSGNWKNSGLQEETFFIRTILFTEELFQQWYYYMTAVLYYVRVPVFFTSDLW